VSPFGYDLLSKFLHSVRIGMRRFYGLCAIVPARCTRRPVVC
jgi:hypothetical protein